MRLSVSFFRISISLSTFTINLKTIPEFPDFAHHFKMPIRASTRDFIRMMKRELRKLFNIYINPRRKHRQEGKNENRNGSSTLRNKTIPDE